MMSDSRQNGYFLIVLMSGFCFLSCSSFYIGSVAKIQQPGYGYKYQAKQRRTLASMNYLHSLESTDFRLKSKEGDEFIDVPSSALGDDMQSLSSPIEFGEDIDAEDLETPPLSVILSQLMGINAFTYILAGLIALFLSLNSILGPGWLGQKLGIPGTGEFVQYGQSIPEPVNLNKPENLL